WMDYSNSGRSVVNIQYFEKGKLIVAKEITNGKLSFEYKNIEAKDSSLEYVYNSGDDQISKLIISNFSKKPFESTYCYPERNLKLNKCELWINSLIPNPGLDTLIISSKH